MQKRRNSSALAKELRLVTQHNILWSEDVIQNGRRDPQDVAEM